MFTTNLKLAIRSIWKNKSNSFINLAGLTVGITACLLIALFVQHELSYDHWNPKLDRLVRITSNIKFGESQMKMATSSAVIGPEAIEIMPEIEAFCRIRKYGDYLIKNVDQQNFNEENVILADNSIFKLFPTDIILGDRTALLTKPQQLVLSEKMAKKYFDSPQNAVGKNLILDNNNTYQVTGVFADFPATNHFDADFILSLVGNNEIAETPPFWVTDNNFSTYFLLSPTVTLSQFNSKWEEIVKGKVETALSKVLQTNLAEFEATGQYLKLEIQPVADIHLDPTYEFSLKTSGDRSYVWIFSIIGLMILLIACINYMNLSTAKSTNRTKEIAVRKVLGSYRSSLIQQFLTESITVTAVAFFLAIGVAYFLLPAFSELTARQITFPNDQLSFAAIIIVSIVGIGILAGGYPAFFLSGFKIQKMLRGQLSFSSSKSYSRNLLVIIQFTASTALIISSLFIYRQLNYMQNKKLGYNKEQIVTVNNIYALGDDVATFRQEILRHSGVEALTVSSSIPTPSSRNNWSYLTSPELKGDNGLNLQRWATDENFLNTLGIELVEGRFFDKNLTTDSTSIVVNESAVRAIGMTNPIGKKLYTPNEIGNTSENEFVGHTIIGVVKDFHWSSLRDDIKGLVMALEPSNNLISLRYQSEKSAEVLSALENTWSKFAPDAPLTYEFMDEAYAQIYQTEQRISIIALLFTGLAIFISCLGLLGLVAYMAEQRTREIGIRKVLGASITNIIQLLSADFIKLVIAALIIAIPISYYFMNNWLADFAYRIDLSGWTFAVAGLLTLVVALFTVGTQALQAALVNPVDAIQND